MLAHEVNLAFRSQNLWRQKSKARVSVFVSSCQGDGYEALDNSDAHSGNIHEGSSLINLVILLHENVIKPFLNVTVCEQYRFHLFPLTIRVLHKYKILP